MVIPKKYTISNYTKRKAKQLGVIVKPSKFSNKKLDVFDGKNKNIKLASIGGVKSDGSFYMDYPSYIKKYGKTYADLKRANYLKRHAKEPKFKNGKSKIYQMTPSYFADKLLW